MAKEQPGKGKAVQPAAGSPGDRRVAPALHPPPGKVTITAGARGTVAPKDSHTPGAKALEANAGSVGLGTISAEVFLELVNRGIKSWSVAGELLVTWLSMEPAAYQLIRNKAPWISLATLEMFERLGRKSLFPKVLLLPPMLAERVGRLSYAEQERMCSQPESTIRASVRSASHVQHKDRGRDCKRPGPEPEKSHIANLPCAGYWRVTVTNGKAAIEKCESSPSAVPVVLHDGKYVVLQVLGGYQSDSDQTPSPAKDEINDDLTPAEKAWREFKNDK